MFVLVATGCGISNGTAGSASSAAMAGRVYGGQQPVIGATVTVWQTGNSGYGSGATPLASVTTDSNGSFAFPANSYTCTPSNAPVYITASGGNTGAGATNANSVMAAGLGSCATAPNQTVIINEVTTAATALAMSHFFTTTLGGGVATDQFGAPGANSTTPNVGLVMADNATIPALVNLPSGMVQPNTATKTIESAKIYSIANTLAACINTTGQTSNTETTTVCGQLFNLTTPPGGSTRPADTLQAAVQMALYPYQNVTALYNLTTGNPPFTGLSAAPNDWTVAVAYTNPTMGLGINQVGGFTTSSTIDIDGTGRVWFPTNSATAHGVGYFDPFTQTLNGPYMTTLVQPQYVAIDTTSSQIFATDVAGGAAYVQSTSTAAPSVAGTTYAGLPVATSAGPLVVDTDNTTLFTYDTSGATHNVGLVTSGAFAVSQSAAFIGYPTGLTLQGPPLTPPGQSYLAHKVYAATESASLGCAEELSSTNGGYGQGSQYNSGGTCTSGGIATVYAPATEALMSATSLNKVGSNDSDDFFTPPVPISAPEAIATDGDGRLWIADSGSAAVSTMKFQTPPSFSDADYQQTSPVAYVHDSTHGNTMTKPFGLAIDRSGNVWVSNASCVATSSTPCTATGFTLTEVVGAAAPTITPLSAALYTNTGSRPTQ